MPNPHYPLMDHAAEQLHAASGRPLHDLTLEQVMAGELSPEDLQVHAQTLQAQATVAREAGFVQLAENLERAAELTAVPNEELLRMYTLLRPGRATYDELVTLAQTLANTYAAPRTAAWVQEAAEVYRMRGLAKRTTN
jgi:propanediol dehydratase small subunit